MKNPDTIRIETDIPDDKVRRATLRYYNNRVAPDLIPLDAVIMLAGSEDAIHKIEILPLAEHMIFKELITTEQFMGLMSGEDGLEKFKALSTHEVRTMIDYRLLDSGKAIEILHQPYGKEILRAMSEPCIKNLDRLVPRAGVVDLIDNSIGRKYHREGEAQSWCSKEQGKGMTFQRK